MKFSIKFLLFIFLVQQLLFLDSIFAASLESDGNGSGDLVTLDGSVEGIDDELFDGQMLADQQTSDVGEESNGNVKFIGEGSINLTMKKLSFKLCSDCLGKILICYESDSPDSSLKGDCPDSLQCALQIEGIEDSDTSTRAIRFGPETDQVYYGKPRSAESVCDVIKIEGGSTKFNTSQEFKTCTPKIENGMIQIYVKPAEENKCPVEAVKANIKFPEIITTPSSQTSPKPTNSTPIKSDSGEKTAESSFPWWLIMLICFALLAVVIGIGIAVYCFCFKRPSSKPAPTEISQPPTAIVTTNNAHESTISKTFQAPPKSSKVESVASVAAKPEPSLSKEPEKKTVEKPETSLSKEPVKKTVEEKKVVEKKKHGEAKKKTAKTPEKKKTVVETEEDKKTTIEPTTTTTEEPTPPPKAAVEAPPNPLYAAYNCPSAHIVPKSPHQKRKTSSVEDVIEKNQAADAKIAIESVQDSIHRNYLQDHRDGGVIVKKMKYYYPPYNHAILGVEISLFCICISQMFEYLNELAEGYEEALSGYGVQFDAEHRIVKMTKEGRSYLQKLSTPGTTVLFAFGAEFHEYMYDNRQMMPQFSIQHLLTIALQPRFREFHRRKACTLMRRQLPFIRAVYNAAHREHLPFPICMIEKAFEQEPKYLLDIASLDTDSESKRKDTAHEMPKKKENEGRGGDGQKKKKKKLSKKRH